MWRFLVGVGMLVFSLGAVAAAGLVAMHVVDGQFRVAGGLAACGLFLAWGAWACRLDWRRAQQEREFRREIAQQAARSDGRRE